MRKLLLALALIPAVAFAQGAAPPAQPAKPAAKKPEVYKWVDDKGVVHYTDKPPSDNATPAALPPLQTYKRGTTPDLRKFSSSGSASKPITNVGPQVQLVTPAREETFHERTVPVAVMVTPPLDPDYKLVYYLDGSAQGSPTTDTSYALTEVERGEHSVSVAVVDSSGTELSRSSSVTFYTQLPGVKRK